jgi:ribonuclease BN (tRNA processing enzyme)
MIVIINDIGDGLFIDFRLDNERLVTDFGSQQNIDKELLHRFHHPFPLSFALSHFHSDHYSGLLDLLQLGAYAHIVKVYFPRLPQFSDRSKLLKAFQTVNFYLLGNDSGSMEYDFINLISIINNNKSFKVIPVSQGDFINLGQKSFQVIWPPREIDNSFTNSVQKAIGLFNDELKKNDTLRKIYDSLDDSFYQDKEEESDFESGQAEKRIIKLIDSEQRNQRLELIKDLNDGLREIANRISLAYCNNQLLFLGDLEANEINYSLIYNLSVSNNSYWDIVILPHHGTHWGQEMSKIQCKVGISSLGNKLKDNWEIKNKSIADENYLTYFNGRIIKKLGITCGHTPWGC